MLGPFPAPQIAELLEAGEVTPEWEVSLNGQDWLSIADSGQFEAAQPFQPAEDSANWREERHKARQRWLAENGGVEGAVPRDAAADEQTRQAIARDALRTDALVREAQVTRLNPLIPLLAILALLVVGYLVWQGQTKRPIDPEISSRPDCAAPLGPASNWSHCDKRGLVLGGVVARNARLEKVRLDDAQLPGADLAYAFLAGASLRNAQLGRANLLAADLTGATLAGADLSGANLEYAVLKDADLTGTRLEGARLGKATWPDGRVCAEGAVGACP
ncbi:MAG: pentapeptide repeat-containing protein [Pseudomonadota bacterium]